MYPRTDETFGGGGVVLPLHVSGPLKINDETNNANIVGRGDWL